MTSQVRRTATNEAGGWLSCGMESVMTAKTMHVQAKTINVIKIDMATKCIYIRADC